MRDVAAARIGQFVLVSGDLEILNLAILREAWQDQTIKRLIDAGSQSPSAPLPRQQRRALERKGEGNPGQLKESDVFLTLLKMLPHAVQARIIGDNSVWCYLLDAGMVVSADELLLKHGIKISGTWYSLGILDAILGEVDAAKESPVDPSQGGVVGALLTRLAPIARMFLGRPPDMYGVTPLLIFRKVSGSRGNLGPIGATSVCHSRRRQRLESVI